MLIWHYIALVGGRVRGDVVRARTNENQTIDITTKQVI